jgi:hypothetical protein
MKNMQKHREQVSKYNVKVKISKAGYPTGKQAREPSSQHACMQKGLGNQMSIQIERKKERKKERTKERCTFLQ